MKWIVADTGPINYLIQTNCILSMAAERNLVSLKDALERLQATNMYLSKSLTAELLQQMEP